MKVPQFEKKYLKKAIFNPTDFVDYCKTCNRFPRIKPPESVIMCYQNSVLEYVKKKHATHQGDGIANQLFYLNDMNGKVAVTGRFGIGSPVACVEAEELIALGVKKIISLGTAGTLQKNVNIGDIILCDRAIRDEGTSFHYLEPSKYIYPSADLTHQLESVLSTNNIKFFKGTTWTIDSPYRETIEEVILYQKEGVMTVEMEASALFALGKYRQVDIASIFTISDSLADLKWNPQFHSQKTQSGLENIFDLALTILV